MRARTTGSFCTHTCMPRLVLTRRGGLYLLVMFSIPFARKREQVAIVVYVGSASAGVALGVLHEDSFSLATAETVQALLSDRTREHTIAAVLSALNEAVEKARSAYAATPVFSTHGAPRIGYAVLESPWSRTCTVGAERVLPEEARITKELLGELAREAIASECVPSAAVVARDHFF